MSASWPRTRVWPSLWSLASAQLAGTINDLARGAAEHAGLGFLFTPVRTMTATIAAEMGEVASGSVHYHALFFIGIVLFLISLGINLAASAFIFRQRKRSERILS